MSEKQMEFQLKTIRSTKTSRFGWCICTKTGLIILRSVDVYKTNKQARQWAKYWANKISQHCFEEMDNVNR